MIAPSLSSMLKLGVNIDHVATLRNARGTCYPSPIEAALVAETAGADFITLHLREDRRHIRDEDVFILRKTLKTTMNLELAITPEMLDIACEIKPHEVCLVPEKREEVTTEGGLDVLSHFRAVESAVKRLNAVGTTVSLFIDAEKKQIEAAYKTGAQVIELHTGRYADAETPVHQNAERQRIEQGVKWGLQQGLKVNAGHGLHYHNVQPIAAIQGISELNIGHALIAQAVMVGLPEAIRHMRHLMNTARGVQS